MSDVDVLVMLQRHGVNLKEIRAWTMCYFPFIMGGNVWQPAGTKLECDIPVKIGEHYFCVIHGPNHMMRVCELTTGGIVAHTLEQITDEVNNTEPMILRKQVADARRQMPHIRELTPEDLWRRLKNAKD